MSVFCKVEYKGGRLSITGVEGPLPSGNALGGCGQIDMHLQPGELNLAPGWTMAMARKFLAVWKEWHLNDMHAGTPLQTAELKRHTFPGHPANHYDWAKGVLKDAGLDPDMSLPGGAFPPKGYSYGSAWLSVDVPEDVLAWLQALPVTDKQPAWV